MTLASLAQDVAQHQSSFFDTNWGIYLIQLAKAVGWAVTGGIGMGLGLIVALKTFTRLTGDVDEWKLVKDGNIGMSIILASVVLGTSLVIMSIAKP